MAQVLTDLMDPQHERVFQAAATQFTVVFLVRGANPKSFRFYQQSDYYPKRLDIKAKTARIDAAPFILGSLVDSPVIYPGVFGGRDMQGVKKLGRVFSRRLHSEGWRATHIYACWQLLCA